MCLLLAFAIITSAIICYIHNEVPLEIHWKYQYVSLELQVYKVLILPLLIHGTAKLYIYIYIYIYKYPFPPNVTMTYGR